MRDWKDIRVQGINKIEKVIAEFNVWAIDNVPYGKFKVKILEQPNGQYVGVPNVAVKNQDGIPDGISGLGRTENEALEDTIKYFLKSLEGRTDLTEDDFEWSDPHDF